ncbi:unnamed protein product [Dracunculus medinensis]|uniref:Secreted protein n=1 Tax=Dracunculus medinensis TaxID=318479 RepID=A0A0N4UPI6_DRAME|nr:unnamed protein product [Dracunculus medinensis]
MNSCTLLLIASVTMFTSCESFWWNNRNYIRFRKPDDVWQPPFRTIMCGSFPLKVRLDADVEEVCKGYLERLRTIGELYD